MHPHNRFFHPIESLENRIAPAALGAINLSSLQGFNGFKILGEAPGDSSGYSVSAAGDVNGDGFDDVLIGAIGAPLDGPPAGASYLVFGKAGGLTATVDLSTLNGANGFKIAGENDLDRLGVSVSAAGDFNNDGFDDLLVGAFTASPNGGESGASYLIFGKAKGFSNTLDLSTLNGSNGFKIQGEAASDDSGRSVSAAGDINGDGFDDLLIGAFGHQESKGASYVIFGRAGAVATPFNLSTLTGPNGFKIQGESGGQSSGYSVSGAGDVNADGFDDLIIGAPFGGPDGAGAAYVLFGKAGAFISPFNLSTLNGANGFKIQGETAGAFAGISVSGAGDVNNDGFDDLLIGASGDGSAYLVFGKVTPFSTPLNLSSLNGANGFKILGAASGDGFGRSVSAAGDLNGDGFGDLIIGADQATVPKSGFAGAAYVVFGKTNHFTTPIAVSNLNGVAGFKIEGENDGDRAGHSVSGAGDFNGDGFDDLLIGAPDNAGAGATYVVFGHGAKILNHGKRAIFTDSDGDRVTVNVSKGALQAGNFHFGADGTLARLELDTGFAGSNLSITILGKASGDGRVNVGAIEAAGVDLGAVKIEGDLGHLNAGDSDFSTPGLKRLDLQSLATRDDTQFPNTPTPFQSRIFGNLGMLNVAADVKGFLDVSGGQSRIAGVRIGGNLDGSQGGSIAGAIRASGGIGSVFVKGSVIGGANLSGIFSGGQLGPVVIGHDLTSADELKPVIISALGRLDPVRDRDAIAIQSLKVNGGVQNALVLAGYSTTLEALNGSASIGPVTVNGNWSASSLVAGVADITSDGFGRNDAAIPSGSAGIVSKIASVLIKGSAEGSSRAGSFFGITAQAIGKTRIEGGMLFPDPNQPVFIAPNFTLAVITNATLERLSPLKDDSALGA